MIVHREGDGVRTDLVFDARHLGAPGVAHGGAVAMAFDDLFGFLLYLVGELAVTRNLAVDYLPPVRLGPRYTLRARHDAPIGRRVPVTAELRDPDHVLIATASATFIIVDVEHFLRAAGPV